MIDITNKINTLRMAKAQAIIKVGQKETIEAVQNKTVPKGDVLEMAKAAGLLGVKKTADMIPDCHPMPVEFTGIEYKINDLEILITVTVKTIYKTGVEVEAMHGASVVALTMYDMLKPIDKQIEIREIKLLEKKGGKSDYKDIIDHEVKTAVIVCSDSISAGKKEDKAGKVIMQKLELHGVSTDDYSVIPDDMNTIRAKIEGFCEDEYNMIILTGGTGLSPTDTTPEAIVPILDREIPGIMEAARSHGQQRTPYSMLSRGVAGFKGDTVILALPGSTKGAAETMDALFPYVLHLFKIQEHAYRHQAKD